MVSSYRSLVGFAEVGRTRDQAFEGLGQCVGVLPHIYIPLKWLTGLDHMPHSNKHVLIIPVRYGWNTV